MKIEKAIYKLFYEWEKRSEDLNVDDLIDLGLQTDKEKAKTSADYFLFIAEHIGIELNAKKTKPFLNKE